MKKIFIIIIFWILCSMLLAQAVIVPGWARGNWTRRNNNEYVIESRLEITNRSIKTYFGLTEEIPLLRINDDGTLVFQNSAQTYRITQNDRMVRLERYQSGRWQNAMDFGIPVTGVSITKSQNEIRIGATVQFEATIMPVEASVLGMTWSSNPPGIVTVNNLGIVRGVAPGNTTITVRTTDGGHTATVRVSVPQEVPNWARGTWSNQNYTITVTANNFTSTGIFSDTNLTPTFTRIDGDNTIFFSNNYIIRKDNSSSDIIHLEVKFSNRDYPVWHTFRKGSNQRLTIPSWALGTWTGNNNATAEINTTSFKSSIIRNSTYNITGIQDSNNIWFTSLVKITRNSDTRITVGIRQGDDQFLTDHFFNKQVAPPPPPPPDVVIPTSVAIDPASLILNIGATRQLRAIVLPENSTDKSVTWSSEDIGIATVSSTGLVRAVTSGTTRINVRTVSGNRVARIPVTVNKAEQTNPPIILPPKATVAKIPITVKQPTQAFEHIGIAANGGVALSDMYRNIDEGDGNKYEKLGHTSGATFGLSVPIKLGKSISGNNFSIEPGIRFSQRGFEDKDSQEILLVDHADFYLTIGNFDPSPSFGSNWLADFILGAYIGAAYSHSFEDIFKDDFFILIGSSNKIRVPDTLFYFRLGWEAELGLRKVYQDYKSQNFNIYFGVGYGI